MKANKSQHNRTFKPLSVEQENAIDLLILGKTDRETVEAVGVGRPTVTLWRTQHPLFMATLEQRRAEIWRAPQERLRALLSKAVDNIASAVDAGDVKASIEVLRAVGMYGNGTMNAIHEQNPEKILNAMVDQRLAREPESGDPVQRAMDALYHPERERRRQEIEHELAAKYLEP
jgi:hypothetical protein